MAEKRFTDTGLNKQPWFRKLKPKMKCAIRFIFDECDKAGVWVIDMETLSYFVGEDVTLDELFEKVNSDKQNRIEKFGGDKIFIPGFVAFQYGELSEDCRPHKPIIALLKKYGLYDRVLVGYSKGINTLEDKTIQEKDKEEENDFGKYENLLQIPINDVTLEAAERNQYDLTKQKNTEFIKSQFEIFKLERSNDPPIKKRDYIKYPARLYSHFLNWLRNKKPPNGKDNTGNSNTGTKAVGRSIEFDRA